MPNINENPDYQLVMKFLQNIRPGDMDEESANQLMMIGQRMQGGGILSDREREMFEAVVGSMPKMPMDPNSAVRGREMPMGEMPMDPNSAVREGEMNRSYQVDGDIEQMTPAEYAAAVQRGDITPDQLMMESSGSTTTPAERELKEQEAYFKRLMEEQQALPRLAPDTPQMRPQARPELTRPQARPMMTSPRPQMRR